MNNYYFEVTLKKPNGNIVVKKFGRPFWSLPDRMPIYEEVYNIMNIVENAYPSLKIIDMQIVVGDLNET